MNKKTIVWLIVIAVVVCLIIALLGGTALFVGSQGQAPQAPLPVVQIFYPPELAEVPFGSPIPVGVEASVPEGNQVTRLELWADSELVGQVEGNKVALTTSWNWLPAHASQHVLVGRAFNQEGGEGSAIVTVEVRTDLPDGDQDGVPDQDDKCPEQVGAPEWSGCPPSGAGLIGDAWALGEVLTDEMIAAIEEALAGEGVIPPADGPPVVDPVLDSPDPPEPMALVELEAYNLVSAVGAKDVYCYVTLSSRPLERVPSDAMGNFTETAAGVWNIADFMGGAEGRMMDVPEAGSVHMEFDCWGHFNDALLEPQPRHMGIYVADHGIGDWDGREFVGHGAADANWFDLTYRLCRINCEETTLPAPHNFDLTFVGPDYDLSWQWDGIPGVDYSNVGFHVYRDGIPIVDVLNHNPANTISLVAGEIEPPLCSQEYQFEVRAFRGADVQLSEPSESQWTYSPPCVGDNSITISDSDPSGNSTLVLELDHFYVGDFSERVMIGALPLIDGSEEPDFFWNGTSVGTGGGLTDSDIWYGGSETVTTNGMRLFMLTIDDGIFPFPPAIQAYTRDVPFEHTWHAGLPDLRILRMYYPAGDDILRVAVRNNGVKELEMWAPTFAFLHGPPGGRVRIAGLDSPVLPPQEIKPYTTKVVAWSWPAAVNLPLLPANYDVMVDPDNLVPETNEENNIKSEGKPTKQVVLGRIRVLVYGSSDAAGFPGCFAGLGGSVRVGGAGPSQFYFVGSAQKDTYPTAGGTFMPHEIGLLVCPGVTEFEVEDELIPALGGSCGSVCAGYFGAHGQPMFAEGVSPACGSPPPGWGDDYCGACPTLAGQATISRSHVVDFAYDSGALDIRLILRNFDILPDGTTTVDQFCNFTEAIPEAVMTGALPITLTLTDPGGACEIDVTIQDMP